MRIAALVLALCAGLFGLPAALCSGACGAIAGAASAENSSRWDQPNTQEENERAQAGGAMMMGAGLIGAFAYIIGGFLVLAKGKTGAVGCAIGSVLTGFTVLSLNPLSLIVLLLGLLATVFAFIKKDPVPVPA